MRDQPGPDCLISGGEPVVTAGRAGAAGLRRAKSAVGAGRPWRLAADGAEGLALLSGGTDGEDGPTDAAGAVLDAAVLAAARRRGLDGADFLARNDAYHFFSPLDALIKTGPTHTNVGDLRVVVVEKDY